MAGVYVDEGSGAWSVMYMLCTHPHIEDGWLAVCGRHHLAVVKNPAALQLALDAHAEPARERMVVRACAMVWDSDK